MRSWMKDCKCEDCIEVDDRSEVEEIKNFTI